MIENNFPDRGSIKKVSDYKNKIIKDIKDINIDKMDFSNNGDFKPRSEIIQKQKIYFWIRVYLNEEDSELTPNDTIWIEFNPTGEKLETKFICYAKTGTEIDTPDSITNYTPEDNKKIICLIVDQDKINKNSDNIPVIRSLFKIGNYYQYHLFKREDIIFKTKGGKILEYFDVDF